MWFSFLVREEQVWLRFEIQGEAVNDLRHKGLIGGRELSCSPCIAARFGQVLLGGF